MDVKGKITVFVKRKEVEGVGTITEYNTTVGYKDENGKYINAYLPVRFTKENFPAEKIDKLEENTAYTFKLDVAFLSCRAFQRKDGTDGREIYLQVVTAELVDAKVINKKSNLPF